MRTRIIWCSILVLILACAVSAADLRTYRQFKDVATKANGKVSQSAKQGDLFEYTYLVSHKRKTITRIMIRRLDEPTPTKDATVYNIIQKLELLGSEAGNGDDVLVAVARNGTELLELGHRFAFTSRISPFPQMITGVYKRVRLHDKDEPEEHARHAPHRGHFFGF